MIKKAILCAAAAAMSWAAAGAGDEARLLRFPATNGTELVFTYAGDLYTVPVTGGEAKRLTSHIGYEMFARYSPDGKTIAFTGEYDGNREVYTIPATGGEPFRVTYTATNERDDLGDRMGPNNMIMTWTPDGKGIVYRNRISESFDGKLWIAPVNGGMPEVMPFPEGGWCSWSPDGKSLAYNRVMREFRTWKYYRGGMADDINIYDTKTKKVRKVAVNDAQDIFPMWIGSKIYFASDRDMTMNLFCYDTKTEEVTKVTDFNDYDIKFPSTDGKTIVFEKGGYIYRFFPETGKVEQIHITLSTDAVYARTEQRSVGKKANFTSLSPEGDRIVFTARGEVFDAPMSAGVTRNLSRTPGSNERGSSWSPDGKYIAWIGDGSGESEIYLYDTEKGGDAKQLTKGSDTYIRSILWAPDSKHIIYTDRKNRVNEVDPATGAVKTLFTCPEQEIGDVSYSPDSKWITYSRPAANEMGVVYVRNLATGKEYPVTEKWYDSGNPVFSSDGKYLIFTANRDMNPIYSRIEWNFAMTDMSGLYMALLAADTPSPFLPKDGEKANAAKEEKKEGVAEVKIDANGLIDRVVRIPISGRASRYFSDGKKIWYGGAGGTQVYDLATGKTDKFSDGVTTWRMGDKFAIVRQGSNIYASKLGAKASTGSSADLGNAIATIDYAQEWPQIFDEVWRAFRDGFYVENMHGVDWKGIKAKYAELLPYVKTRLDLNYVIGEMISELACGHAYVTVGDYPKPERIEMGLLGAEISKHKSGYFRIDKILQGAPYSEKLRSPLTEPGVGVEVGNYITAIDGLSLKDVPNIYSKLVGKAGKLVELTVNTKAEEGGKKVVIKPIADEYPLYHYEWVQNNIKTVEEKSGGKVGYIYIPDMGPEGLSEFARYYYAQLDKEALIIDDRANGGGNISPMVIERLKREVYRMTMYRTSSRNGTIPEGTHTGPKVLLINKYSASDGDLFPWSFKANNLGTVIGTRTWGGIVGISGSLPYMDGTDVRVPFFTNYDVKTGGWIVENHGVDPDILIDNDPIKENQCIDEQLLKAIEVALEQIKDRKPLPSTPSPRTFKDLGL